jgi:hypothetical protein
MNYVIIVDDSGELKTVTAAELEAQEPTFQQFMDHHLNAILDRRAVKEPAHDPDQNITMPFLPGTIFHHSA